MEHQKAVKATNELKCQNLIQITVKNTQHK